MIFEFDLNVNGEKVSYPFHFGMSVVRTFAAKKGWKESWSILFPKLFGNDASFQDQSEILIMAAKNGIAYTNSKLPMPAESDIIDQFHIIYASFYKEYSHNISEYLRVAEIDIPKNQEGREGKEELVKT